MLRFITTAICVVLPAFLLSSCATEEVRVPVFTSSAYYIVLPNEVQRCPAGYNALNDINGKKAGCVPLQNISIDAGMDCDRLPNGTKAVDRTGATYICEE